jgi:glycosyltransferase involved in cell wall biosynthesis
MKIAFVNDAVYPYVKGGVEKRINELGLRLAERGHQVELFGLKWWDGAASSIEEGRMKITGVGPGRDFYVQGRRSIAEAIAFGAEVLRPLLRESFDIVDCQGAPYFPCFSSKVASLFKREPLVITWHEVWNEYWYEYLGRAGVAGQAIERMTAGLTDHQVAVSESTKRDLERIRSDPPATVIPNGIDFDRIRKVHRSAIESDIIFAGRLIKDKHVDLLVRSVRIVADTIPDIRCLIVGDGPEYRHLRTLTNELGLDDSIAFTGFVDDYEGMIGLMHASKVFALPSTREGFGIVVLEAMASGIPVVTFDHPMNAARYLITPETGSVVAPEAEAFAKALIDHLESPRSRSRCIEHARPFDWDHVTTELERWYGLVAR